ncbi:glycosyltransferase family 2 protein [Pontibacter diazotrophicus]|uniref:Glycosyltransferase family 2 protein n=1 Tax=Pontibacter diazotrophicus TaxID=1400979 RepID=A0A3D8LH45_9BACT|nr:glycosyltransferase family A protein [Pontibacter diazotrophicus]RDV16697.1 glycosyltransferase family 2 protein [Pontibacter diazotrophicus]
MSKLTKLLKHLIPHKLERTLRTYRDINLRNYNDTALPEEIYKQDHYYSISFCSTCMNRLFHLRHTLEKNIQNNRSYPNIEFVLIDYNSQDGLEDYVKENWSHYIEQGVLNYYKTFQPQTFHASKAKNLSHALAKGDIVCNVDGDNFTGKDLAYYINYLYNQHGENNIFQFHKPPFWGTVGRLTFFKEAFMRLGGYDEDLLPIGHEDLDLVNRGREIGLEFKQEKQENFLRYLSNTTLEKSINCTAEPKNYYELEGANRIQSNNNIKNGILTANAGGMENFIIYKNFSEEALNSKDLIMKHGKSMPV